MADNLESRTEKASKVVKAGTGLTAFVAGWCFDLWVVDEAMIGTGIYLMYKGRDTIQYIKEAYGGK
ncbi:MAG: hypothetical protein QME12_02930 [Nanoarchaeota archaeon]|nr:hypothetical protein [Nanoarchaeota archaeon]